MTVTFQDVMQRMGDGVDILIADQTLELGGEEFVWSHNVAGNSWSWRAADYMDPPTAMKLRLNRLFIEQKAAQVATALEPVPKFVFVDVLKRWARLTNRSRWRDWAISWHCRTRSIG